MLGVFQTSGVRQDVDVFQKRTNHRAVGKQRVIRTSRGITGHSVRGVVSVRNRVKDSECVLRAFLSVLRGYKKF